MQKFSVKNNISLFLIFLIIIRLYTLNLTGWLCDDDEGSYAYCSWRASLGEEPYRDFFLAQMPFFIFLGSLIFKIFGVNIIFLRLASIISTLICSWFIYLIAKLLFTKRIAILSSILYLLHYSTFYNSRFFRADTFSMVFVLLGIYLLLTGLRFIKNDNLFLFSGIFFAIATMIKLSALLVLIGSLLFLVYATLKIKLNHRKLYFFISGFLIFIVYYFIYFQLKYKKIIDFAILDQFLLYSNKSSLTASLEKISIIIKYVWYFKFFMFPVMFFLLLNLKRKQNCKNFLFFWMAPILLSIFMKRKLEFRHLQMFVPAFCIAFSYVIFYFLRSKHFLKRTVAIVLVLFVIYSMAYLNSICSLAYETDTLKLSDYIKKLVPDNQIVFCDYSGLNFYAQRKTTYWGASLSSNAWRAGEITGEKLISDMIVYKPEIILFHISGKTPYFDKYFFKSIPPHHLNQFANPMGDDAFMKFIEKEYLLKQVFIRCGQKFNIYEKRRL